MSITPDVIAGIERRHEECEAHHVAWSWAPGGQAAHNDRATLLLALTEAQERAERAEEALADLADCQPLPKVYKYTGTAEVDVESMFDVGHRHKSGKQPRDYLMSWLSMFRPFAYATKDDSWGELEKLISIVMNNYVQILVRAEAARATQKGTSDALPE